MNAYIDSSVVLRVAFGEAEPLQEWQEVEQFTASALLVVECFRAADRVKFTIALSDEEVVRRYDAVRQRVERINLVDITQPILNRASQSFPIPLKTLDAIHLATAIEWRETNDRELVFATHDRTLGNAARTVGFRVLGL